MWWEKAVKNGVNKFRLSDLEVEKTRVIPKKWLFHRGVKSANIRVSPFPQWFSPMPVDLRKAVKLFDG